MSYITTDFREFVKEKLIQETKKESRLFQQNEKTETKPPKLNWFDKLNQEWNELFKENDKTYDDLYK